MLTSIILLCLYSVCRIALISSHLVTRALKHTVAPTDTAIVEYGQKFADLKAALLAHAVINTEITVLRSSSRCRPRSSSCWLLSHSMSCTSLLIFGEVFPVLGALMFITFSPNPDSCPHLRFKFWPRSQLVLKQPPWLEAGFEPLFYSRKPAS